MILLYGSKDWESITFREELEALKARLNLTVVHVLPNPPAGWTGESGYITAEIFKRHLPLPYADHEYFICGPDVMMDAIEKALGELQVPLSKYHSERYSFAGGPDVRRLFADRLVLATGAIVILMSLLFALLRVAG